MNRVKEAKVRILVCEDNPADVDLLRLALTEAGIECELSVIDDGSDALLLARRSDFPGGAPDLAIIDLNLPKHGGMEILERMRANQKLAEVPVVILSSSSSPLDRAKAEKLGVQRYIVKPLDLEEFLKIGREVREILESGPAEEHSL